MTARKNFYVYAHYSPLTGECFYIGKGTGNRRYSKWNRNSHWRNKVKKHGGFDVKILIDNLLEEQAFEIEMLYIESVGLDNLCNMTVGGEGISGYKHSKETCKKLSISNSGKKLSPDTCKKMSDSRKGKKYALGYRHTEEAKMRIREASTGRKLSEEARKKLSESTKGEKNHKFGKFGKDSTAAKAVSQYTKDDKYIQTFDSMKIAEGNTGVNFKSISSCCRGKTRFAGQFIWKYAEN